jgi:hypothetical protein
MKIAHIVNILEMQPKHEASYLHIALQLLKNK